LKFNPSIECIQNLCPSPSVLLPHMYLQCEHKLTRVLKEERDTWESTSGWGLPLLNFSSAIEAWPNILLFCWLLTSPRKLTHWPHVHNFKPCSPFSVCNSSSISFFPQSVISKFSSIGTQILKENAILSHCKIVKKNNDLSLSNLAVSLLLHTRYYT